MKRTQIYLDEEIFSILERESKMKKKSISELIRESIHEKYSYNSGKIIKHLNMVFGIWSDKDDDVDTYIRNIRKDRKL
jgi:predicted CopG family antitoxin